MSLVDHINAENSRLYNLIDQYRIMIPPTDLALYQTLGPSLHSLKDALDLAIDTKEEKIAKFSIDLEKSMNELMAEVLEIRNRAQDPMILNPSSNYESVFAFLEDLRSQLSNAENMKTKYESWSRLFKVGGSLDPSKEEEVVEAPVSTQPGELEETQTEVELKCTLWNSLHQWQLLTEYFFKIDILETGKMSLSKVSILKKSILKSMLS
jgi:dynein heavy chain